MVKMHKLTKGGQTIYPATITDAVVNPNTRKSLTAELAEIVNTTGKKLLQWVSFDAEKLIKPDGSISNMSNSNYCVATYQVTSNSQVRICLNLKYNINGSCVFVLKKDDTIVYTQLAGESKVFQYEIYTGECNTLLLQMNSQANTLAYISETPPIIGLVNDQVIEDGSITTPKLANNSVTAEKLDESLYNNLVFKGENVVYDEILSNSIIKKDGLLDTSSQYYKNYRLFKYSVAQGTQYSFSTTLKRGVTPGGFGIVSLFKGNTFVKHAVLSSSSLTYNGDIAVDVDCDLAYILSDKDLVPNLTKSSSIIEDGSITTPKLANNSVTAEKLDESITQEITNLIEFRKYQQGGYNVANTSGEYDRKMAETLYSIIQAQPTADIYVVDNYYGGYNNWSSPGRTYAQELKAMADWFSLGFISLKDAGIRERVDKEARVFTIDGLHAYTEIGAKRIYNRIMGQLLQRYNCDKSELTQKTFLLLGDSTSIIGEPTSWAKLLTEEFPGNVTVRAVAGTGWIDNNEGGGRNVLEQFNVDSVTQYDIIIITSGFNEYHHFQLDYASTIKYLSVYYNQLG